MPPPAVEARSPVFCKRLVQSCSNTLNQIGARLVTTPSAAKLGCLNLCPQSSALLFLPRFVCDTTSQHFNTVSMGSHATDHYVAQDGAEGTHWLRKAVARPECSELCLAQWRGSAGNMRVRVVPLRQQPLSPIPDPRS